MDEQFEMFKMIEKCPNCNSPILEQILWQFPIEKPIIYTCNCHKDKDFFKKYSLDE